MGRRATKPKKQVRGWLHKHCKKCSLPFLTLRTRRENCDHCRSRNHQLPENTARAIRPCMCCRNKFMSEGKHNRLCDFCTRQAGNFNAAFLTGNPIAKRVGFE